MATVEQRVPPLAAGDRLGREEFLRLWEAHPEIKKAELIGGIVYMPSPVSIEHGDKEGDVGGWILVYRAATPGTGSGHNTTSFIRDDTVQPDINLRVLPEYGGRSHVEDGYIAGSPELLTEISVSSISYDLHQKLDLYQAARIPEYLAVLMFEREIRWHVLVKGVYQLLLPDEHGVYRSRVFPGLWLDGPALLSGDTARMLAKLQEGLRSPEHAEFVAMLAGRKKT